jgi:hypothetical protein
MDTVHAWALWRLVMFGLIALPFLVAAVVVGIRQSHADSSISSAAPDDKTASLEIAGPGAWGRDVDAAAEAVPVDARVVERRAA